MSYLIQFILGLLVANIGEWIMHRYLLHALGARKNSWWAYHLRQHHYISQQSEMMDLGYLHRPNIHNTQGKELIVLTSILLIHSPLFFWAPGYLAAVYCSVLMYYILHRCSHIYPGWAKKHLPWHYDHHFYHCNANWCVTFPLFDYIIGTRRKRP